MNGKNKGSITLSSRNLRVGDIIFTTTNKPVSAAIRKFTKSDVSHAMIYCSEEEIIHADSIGVHSLHLTEIALPANRPIYIRRMPRNLTSEEMLCIQVFCRGENGNAYSTLEAMKAKGLSQGNKISDFNRKQYCSRLVAQAYASIGIMLVGNPDYCSPHDLKVSKNLIQIEPIIVPSGGASLFQEKISRFRKMEIAAADFLRSLTKSGIKNLDDIPSYVSRNPNMIKPIHSGLEEIGYFKLSSFYDKNRRWQWEIDYWKNEIESIDVIKEYFRLSVKQDALQSQIFGKKSVAVHLAMRTIYDQAGMSHEVEMLNDLYHIYCNIATVCMDSHSIALECLNCKPSESVYY